MARSMSSVVTEYWNWAGRKDSMATSAHRPFEGVKSGSLDKAPMDRNISMDSLSGTPDRALYAWQSARTCFPYPMAASRTRHVRDAT